MKREELIACWVEMGGHASPWTLFFKEMTCANFDRGAFLIHTVTPEGEDVLQTFKDKDSLISLMEKAKAADNSEALEDVVRRWTKKGKAHTTTVHGPNHITFRHKGRYAGVWYSDNINTLPHYHVQGVTPKNIWGATVKEFASKLLDKRKSA